MKYFFCSLLILFLSSCAANSHLDNRLNQDFYSDLGSENNRIEATLYLDEFNEDLSMLTYDYYLNYLSTNEAPAAKGTYATIKEADDHFFIANKHSFQLVLLYKTDKTVIYDHSGTAFLDSVCTYKESGSIPMLRQFVR